MKLLDLTANDDVHITVSIMPFEVSKETTTIKLDGSKKVTNETIETIDIADEELISKYDEIKDLNGAILGYSKSFNVKIYKKGIDICKLL